MPTVTSLDGSVIAHDRAESGPSLILVEGAFCHRALGPALKPAALAASERIAGEVLRKQNHNVSMKVLAPVVIGLFTKNHTMSEGTVMSKFATIEEYVASLDEPLRAIAARAVKLIDATESTGSRAVWHGHPVWSIGPAPANGPFCYVKAYSKHVTLGFWGATDLAADDRRVKLGNRGMGSVKLSSLEDVADLPVEAWVRRTRAVVAAGG